MKFSNIFLLKLRNKNKYNLKRFKTTIIAFTSSVKRKLAKITIVKRQQFIYWSLIISLSS